MLAKQLVAPYGIPKTGAPIQLTARPVQIYASPFPGPGGKRQISTAGGLFPRWRRDGKESFYVTNDGQLMAAEVDARNGTLEVGRVQRLFDGVITGRMTPPLTAKNSS